MNLTPGDIALLRTNIHQLAARYCVRCEMGHGVGYVGGNGELGPQYHYLHGTDVTESGTTIGPEPCGAEPLFEFLRASGLNALTHETPPDSISIRADSERITEEWLAEVGFKWHEMDRSPKKHWLLWLGEALSHPRRMWSSYDDLGIELTPSIVDDRGAGEWHCWLRGDSAGRYHRFIHTRYIQYQHELILMIEGLTGQTWEPANNLYGSMRYPERAKALRDEDERLDKVIRAGRMAWYEVEKDDTRAGALPEDLEEAAAAREGRKP